MSGDIIWCPLFSRFVSCDQLCEFHWHYHIYAFAFSVFVSPLPSRSLSVSSKFKFIFDYMLMRIDRVVEELSLFNSSFYQTERIPWEQWQRCALQCTGTGVCIVCCYSKNMRTRCPLEAVHIEIRVDLVFWSIINACYERLREKTSIFIIALIPSGFRFLLIAPSLSVRLTLSLSVLCA